jgi:hypothetical protein
MDYIIIFKPVLPVAKEGFFTWPEVEVSRANEKWGETLTGSPRQSVPD